MNEWALGALALVLLGGASVFVRQRFVALRGAKQQLEADARARSAQLADHEAFIRTLTETGPSSLVVSDRGGRIRHVNSRWTELFGYAQHEAMQLPAASVHADGAREQLTERLQRDGLLRQCESRFARKDGSEFWGLLNATRVMVGGESLLATWIVDISDEHAAAERLRTLAAEQDLLLQNLQVGIVYTGDGRMLRANPRFAEMFGFADTQSLVGLPTPCLYADEAEFRRFGAEAGKALGAGQVFSGEWSAARQDGSLFDAYARARAIASPGYQHATIWMIDDITERKRADDALKDSEAYNRMLFQESETAIVLYDPEQNAYVDCNDAALRLHGVAQRQDLLGRSLLDMSAPQQPTGPAAELLPAQWRRFKDEAQPAVTMEWDYLRPGGEAWTSETRVLKFNHHGRALLQITLSDTTATKAAQREVVELTAFLQSIIDRIPNAVFYKGPDTRLMGCNQAFVQMFGVPPESFVGKRVDELDFLPRTVRDKLQAEDETVLAHSTRVQREMHLRFADGQMHHTLYSVSGFHKPDGSPGGVVGTIVDVNALKQAQDDLRVAHAAQVAIFETASVGICILRDGVVLRCNRRLEEIFGFDAGELQGQRTRMWYPSDAAYESGREAANALIGADTRHEQQLRRKDGRLFWCRMQARYIDPNSTHGSVWVMEDVTEENQAADALREAKRLADEATQAKSMFLANMSHEIRTPMNAIIGLSMLALRTELNPKQRDYIAKVHGAGTALLGIINDILDFSKVEAGKLDIESVPFQLDQVLGNMSSLVGQKASEKGLELLLDMAPDVPPTLMGDPLRLGQIITNLVSNAVKFTERGQVLVQVRQHARDAASVLLQVEVRDSGIGMTQEQSGRLFQAFAQADGSTTRKYGGTGLGLTISKRLVEAMGGTLQVESALGEGSRFWFSVRLGMGPHDGAARPALPASAHGMRALVVDDNASAREIFTAQLEELGFAVQSVDSGEQAIATLAQADTAHAFGLMLVDWKMPGLDGIATVERIPPLQRPRHIVMATAFGQEQVRARAENAGIDAFIVKPVSPGTLAHTLRMLLAPPDSSTPAQAQPLRPAVSLHGVRLLLAEDNEINQQIATELLEGAGATVAIAQNGREAVDMAGDGSAYDAVLMDLQMPVMDGIQATQRIRADPRLAGLPIIAMTAHAMLEERERCLAVGMVDHITKPIDPQAMFQTLARWVRPRGTPSTSAPVAQAPATARPAVALPSVPGLDAAAGLARVGGNHALYLRLLHQFRDKQADAGARIAAALAATDVATAERTAHTVRGVAGNIGLGAVQHSAMVLEQAIGSGAATAAPLAAFEAALSAAIAALAALPREAAPVPAEAAADPARAAAHAAHLAQLLAASDGEAADYFSAHRAALREALGDSAAEQVARALGDYEFEQALEHLRTAAEARGVAL